MEINLALFMIAVCVWGVTINKSITALEKRIEELEER